MLRHLVPIRNYARRAGIPGLNKLSKELKDVNEIFEDPEGFGDIESDFMEVHKNHKQHEREMQDHRERIRHFTVGNKYFRTKQPNFLTYAEKEQIKLLHSRDPQEWDPEKLSESFPATPEVIAQIIKGKWIAARSQRVQRHDESVIENWKMFREGKFTELDPALEQHLRKFANRQPEDLRSLHTVTLPKPELPKPNRTEFLSIITESTKFRRLAQPRLSASSEVGDSTGQQEPDEDKTNSSRIPSPNSNPLPLATNQRMDDETYLVDQVQNKTPMRFRDLVRRNPEVQQDSKETALHQIANPQGTGVLASNSKDNARDLSEVNKFAVNEVELNARDMISLSSGIRERIHIPKRLWKRGSIYKVSDCYYDSDGEFLYRVPGMTGRHVEE